MYILFRRFDSGIFTTHSMHIIFRILMYFITFMSPFVFPNIGSANERFEYRISDAIAPFFDARESVQHTLSIPYEQLDMPQYPYVDTDQLAQSKVRFIRYLSLLSKSGYNTVTLDDMAHIVTLDSLGIYTPESPIYLRNSIYKTYFRELTRIAKQQ